VKINDEIKILRGVRPEQAFQSAKSNSTFGPSRSATGQQPESHLHSLKDQRSPTLIAPTATVIPRKHREIAGEVREVAGRPDNHVAELAEIDDQNISRLKSH